MSKAHPRPKVYHFSTLDSTNIQAHRLADSALEWTVVIADVQTQGHGRKGRVWQSPLGGLWFSLILRPELTSLESGILQFYAANSARRAVEMLAQKPCGVKWPNDLILDERKVGGILVETKVLGGKVLYAILGIGVNLNVSGRLLPEAATSILQSTGKHVDRDEACQAIVEELRSTYPRLRDPSSVMKEWWAKCVHREKRVELQLPDSSRIEGKNVRIDSVGQLVVQEEGGRLLKISEGNLRTLE